MKDSTKKWLTITGGLVICAILVFVISQQFTKDKPDVYKRQGLEAATH